LAYEVRSVSHTGITVSDLDEAVGFWTEVLGFEFLGSGEVGGTLVENTTGVPGAHVRVAVVSKGGASIELAQFTAPEDRKTMRPRPCDVGSVHVALEVDDIEAVAEACAGYGWDMPGRIETYSEGSLAGTKLVYLSNDDGTVIELIELPVA
jgi:catechol 2,3-dioxygenase-like lactoylglutathione lyase family enzyme